MALNKSKLEDDLFDAVSTSFKLDDIPAGKEKDSAAKSYQELCDSTGFRIVVSPNFVGRDDGTFSVVLNYTVGQLPKPEEKKLCERDKW